MPKINKLPQAENLTGFEEIPVVQNGKTVRTTISKISAHMVFSFEEFADMLRPSLVFAFRYLV